MSSLSGPPRRRGGFPLERLLSLGGAVALVVIGVFIHAGVAPFVLAGVLIAWFLFATFGSKPPGPPGPRGYGESSINGDNMSAASRYGGA